MSHMNQKSGLVSRNMAAAWRDRAEAAEAENARLLAEVATLREALKPFARLADRFDPALPDDDVLASIPAIQFALYDVTRGDLRRARDVLGVSRLTEEPK